MSISRQEYWSGKLFPPPGDLPDPGMEPGSPAPQETQEMQVGSLGGEDPPEEEMATHSRVLAWRTPWTEEPGGLQSIRLQRAGQDLVTKQFSNKTPTTITQE